MSGSLGDILKVTAVIALALIIVSFVFFVVLKYNRTGTDAVDEINSEVSTTVRLRTDQYDNASMNGANVIEAIRKLTGTVSVVIYNRKGATAAGLVHTTGTDLYPDNLITILKDFSKGQEPANAYYIMYQENDSYYVKGNDTNVYWKIEPEDMYISYVVKNESNLPAFIVFVCQ